MMSQMIALLNFFSNQGMWLERTTDHSYSFFEDHFNLIHICELSLTQGIFDTNISFIVELEHFFEQ